MDINPAELSYIPTTGVKRFHEAPLVLATDASLAGYGCLVLEPRSFPIEITPWPAQGRRPVDKNTGDQGGITEGLFESWWDGETLYAQNGAVKPSSCRWRCRATTSRRTSSPPSCATEAQASTCTPMSGTAR